MNNIHPNEMMLQKYALGELDDIMLMLLSAHLSFVGSAKKITARIVASSKASTMASLLDQVAFSISTV